MAYQKPFPQDFIDPPMSALVEQCILFAVTKHYPLVCTDIIQLITHSKD